MITSDPVAAIARGERRKLAAKTNKPKPSRKRSGNPNWGRPMDYLMPTIPSAFDDKVKALNLQPDRYAQSKELRTWTRLNYKTRYVPEILLEAWGLTDVE